MKKTNFLTLLIFLILSTTIKAQKYDISEETFNKQNIEVDWITYEEALEKQKTNPKKIIIRYISNINRINLSEKKSRHTYKNLFSNVELIKYVDENFYAVKIESAEEMIDFDIKFPENFIEMKREKEAFRREYEINHETRKEKREREKKEKIDGIKIANNYYMEDFLRDKMMGTLSKLIFIDEEGKYICQFEGYPNLKTLEYYLKIMGSNKYKEIMTEEEVKEYHNNLNSFEEEEEKRMSKTINDYGKNDERYTQLQNTIKTTYFEYSKKDLNKPIELTIETVNKDTGISINYGIQWDRVAGYFKSEKDNKFYIVIIFDASGSNAFVSKYELKNDEDESFWYGSWVDCRDWELTFFSKKRRDEFYSAMKYFLDK